MMGFDPALLRNFPFQFGFHVQERILRFCKTQPAGYPAYMRIHRKCGKSITFTHDDIGAFATNAGQRYKFLHRIRHSAVKPFHHAACHALNRLCLVAVKSQGSDTALNIRKIRPGKRKGIRILFKQCRRYAVDGCVRRLCGKHDRHGHLIIVRMFQLAVCIGKEFIQRFQYGLCLHMPPFPARSFPTYSSFSSIPAEYCRYTESKLSDTCLPHAAQG